MTAAVRAIAIAILVVGFAFGLLVSATYRAPAQGAVPCAPWSLMKARLENTFKEVPIGGGPTKTGKGATFVLASPGGATFTIVVVNHLGIACMIAAGVDWTVDTTSKASERKS